MFPPIQRNEFVPIRHLLVAMTPGPLIAPVTFRAFSPRDRRSVPPGRIRGTRIALCTCSMIGFTSAG